MLQVVVNKMISLVRWIMTSRGEKRVQTDSEGVLEKRRDDPLQDGAVDLQARIVVGLDEPGFELSVDHEIQAQKFEVVPKSFLIEEQIVGHEQIGPDVPHLPQNILLEVGLPGVLEIQVPLKLAIGQFIASLVLLIGLSSFLNGIVSQMHKHVVSQKIELVTAGPDVAVLVPVSLDLAIDRGHEHEVTDVELPVVVEKRTREVVLNDVGQGLAVEVLCFGKEAADVAERGHVYRLASVCVLPWFDNPELAAFFLVLLHKTKVLHIFKGSNVVCLGHIAEGVQASDVSMVVQQGFEEVLLGAQTVIVLQMVGHDIRPEGLLKRKTKPFRKNELFNCH